VKNLIYLVSHVVAQGQTAHVQTEPSSNELQVAEHESALHDQDEEQDLYLHVVREKQLYILDEHGFVLSPKIADDQDEAIGQNYSIRFTTTTQEVTYEYDLLIQSLP
jgi:hypothetical protein